MKELLNILTGAKYCAAVLAIYFIVVFIQGFTTDLFDFAVIYDPSVNFGIWLLILFGLLRLIYYIWDEIDINRHYRKDRFNGF